MVAKDGLYYLFYSGNDWRGRYGMGYAVARSPQGPFVKSLSNPILQGSPRLDGPGGGAVFEDEAGGIHLAYHAWGTVGRTFRLANLQLTQGSAKLIATERR